VNLNFSAQDKAEWRENWRVVVAAALGFALMNLTPHSIGIFTVPLAEEFGWKRSIIASGVMFTAVASIVLGPIVGLAVDRFGPRRIVLVGAPLVCTVFAMYSLTTANPWSWWAIWTLMALCFPMVMPMVWTAAVTSLFNSSRGLALAAALAGTAATSAILPILATFLMEHFGWRGAYAGLAGIYAILVLPVIFFFFTSATDRERRLPQQSRTRQSITLPGKGGREIFTSSLYLRFVLAASAMIAVSSVGSTIIPIMRSFGHSQMSAAGIAGLIGIAGFFGRFIGGYLLDRFNGNVVAALAVTIPVAPILLILNAPHSIELITTAAIILGLCVGAELDAVAYLATRHFGLKSYGLVMSVTSAVQFIAMGLGPIGLNHVFDVTGSYVPGMWVAAGICVLSAMLFLSLGKYRYAAPGRDGAISH